MDILSDKQKILKEINNILSYRYINPLETIISNPNELEDLIYSFILLRHKLGEPHNVWFKAMFGYKLPLNKRYQWV